jgi:hypothetical protein
MSSAGRSVVVTTGDSRLASAVAYVRANGLRTGLEVVVNFVLPFAIYNYASGRIGPAPALMAAGAPPVLWSIVQFIRERKLDAISILVLSGIALSLLAFAGGGGVKFLQLRENLVGGVVGLVFLGSAAIGRPLIYQLAKAGAQRRAKRADLVEALKEDVGFRRAMTVTTLVWGVGLLAVCAINCVLVFTISIKLFLLVSGPISYGLTGVLTGWTFWFVPRAMRAAWTRNGLSPDVQATAD